MNSLIFQNLSRICSRQGWRLSITNENDDETYLDFIYHTSSGEPFTVSICFTELYEVAAEIMTEFEDEPSILSRHTGQKKREPKRVEQPPKRDTRRPEPPMPKEEDDDIEFLDLNDL